MPKSRLGRPPFSRAMRVAFAQYEIHEALTAIEAQLTTEVGKPWDILWKFPGGGRHALCTWEHWMKRRPLTIGLGQHNTRTLLLLACEAPRSGMTSTVEVNIPHGARAPDRRINGCICTGSDSQFFLGHRGLGFTVRAHQRIPQRTIHEHFSKWMKEVRDGDRTSRIIIVAPIKQGLANHLSAFAYGVKSLKDRCG